MMTKLISIILILFFTEAFSATKSINDYQPLKLRGWSIKVQKTLLVKVDLWQQTKEVLDLQLLRVSRIVPKKQLTFFKTVQIFIDLNTNNGACYHPNAAWLKENNYIPQKHRAIEISNAKNFTQWTKNQPWMMLHELAHAYHHQVLKFDHKQISELYNKAIEKGQYNSVLHISGRKQKHYAMNDHKEYFAEATEAFLGRNDFYPFVKPELKLHDPHLYQLLQKIWQ